jgi:hypothetical protein
MKRIVRVALIGCAVLVVIYFVVLLVAGISPYVVDSDLRVTRETFAAGDNGFDSLQTAASKLWWPKEQEAALGPLITEANWNVALAAEVLAKNQPALAAFDAALTAPGFQVPEFRVSDGFPYLSEWKRLAQVAAIRGNTLFRAGQEAQAFEQAMRLVQLGNRMEDSKGTVIHYLVGAAVKSIGLTQMRRWAGRAHLSPAQLTELSSRLRSSADHGTALTNALKMEYAISMQTLADLRAGKFKDEIRTPLITWRLLPTFNHGKTKRLFTTGTRALLAAIPVPYGAAKLPVSAQNRPGPLRLVFSGNLAGQVFYYMTTPSLVGTIQAKSRGRVQLEATRLTLALRAYQLKNGRLPNELAALTPDFIEAVPLDDFDGQPLRYLPERRLIYSIGENLRDDQGEAKDAQDHRLDYPFPLEL